MKTDMIGMLNLAANVTIILLLTYGLYKDGRLTSFVAAVKRVASMFKRTANERP